MTLTAKQLRTELDSMLTIAKEKLATKVRETIDSINKKDGSDETNILLYEYGISQPVYREDSHDENMNQCICIAWVDGEGKVGFEVDTFDNGYDISIDDLDIDMVLYLLEGFEDVSI
jgi:hypothetical protein